MIFPNEIVAQVDHEQLGNDTVAKVKIGTLPWVAGCTRRHSSSVYHGWPPIAGVSICSCTNDRRDDTATAVVPVAVTAAVATTSWLLIACYGEVRRICPPTIAIEVADLSFLMTLESPTKSNSATLRRSLLSLAATAAVVVYRYHPIISVP